MASTLTLPIPDLWLLAGGTSVVAFAPRHAVDLNDEVELWAGPPRPKSELRPGLASICHESPPGDLTALVIGLQPASSLSTESDSHYLTFVPEGDVLILRVYQGERPVLEDAAFEARRVEVEADFR